MVDFQTRALFTTETFVKGLNWHLPPEVRVRGAWDTSLDFNSRRDAVSRVYRYTLLNARWPSALLRDFSHHVPQPLDVEIIGEAAGYLHGTHDFSAFTVSLPPRRTTVRRVRRWDVWREGELVLIESEANGFLPHQIRRTNGLLVEIGLGRLPVERIKAIIDGTLKEPVQAPLLPAKGLCLMNVNYREFPGAEDFDEAR